MSDFDTTGHDAVEESAQPTPSSPAPKVRAARPKKPSIFRDPLVRRLSFVAMGLVVLYLVTVVAALVTGVLGSDVPRTRVQNDLIQAEAKVQATPADITAWKSYASALINDGQYRKAQDVIDQATEAVDQSSTQDLLMIQAALYYETGRYDEAIETCDEVRDKLKTFHETALADPESIQSKLGEKININYWEALILKAEALAKTGDPEGALEALDEYLEEKPTAADVLIRRGDLRAEQGDNEGAEADYRAALQFLPDDEAALEGLKKIGAE